MILNPQTTTRVEQAPYKSLLALYVRRAIHFNEKVFHSINYIHVGFEEKEATPADGMPIRVWITQHYVVSVPI